MLEALQTLLLLTLRWCPKCWKHCRHYYQGLLLLMLLMLEALQTLLPVTLHWCPKCWKRCRHYYQWLFVDALNVGNVADIITSDSSLMPSMLETLRTLIPVTFFIDALNVGSVAGIITSDSTDQNSCTFLPCVCVWCWGICHVWLWCICHHQHH